MAQPSQKQHSTGVGGILKKMQQKIMADNQISQYVKKQLPPLARVAESKSSVRSLPPIENGSGDSVTGMITQCRTASNDMLGAQARAPIQYDTYTPMQSSNFQLATSKESIIMNVNDFSL